MLFLYNMILVESHKAMKQNVDNQNRHLQISSILLLVLLSLLWWLLLIEMKSHVDEPDLELPK